ncbi:MAG: YIP1 family protein [bacterium]|nr:YIP1 family protein [bacterium]
MSGLEITYYMFAKPKIGIRAFQERQPVGFAFLIVLLAAISTNVAGVLLTSMNLNTAKIILSFGLVSRLIFIMGIWIIGTAIIHLFAEWLDGEGKVTTLFTALGFCFLPAILSTPFVLLIQNSGSIKLLLYLLFNLIILFWMVELQIISVKEIYHVSSFRAVMVLSTPAVLCVIAIISLLVIAFLMAFSFTSSLFKSLPFFR